MMTPDTGYSIQQVSAATGLPTSTLRYYEDMGLLEPVERASNGHRRFTEADMQRLDTIKKLRLTGMSLETMRGFIDLYRQGTGTAKQRREILTAQRLVVQARVDELLETLGFIDFKIGLYRDEETEYERKHRHEISAVG